MASLDSIVSEVVEEIATSDESNEQLKEILNAYNTNIYGMGHKLKMIAWNRQ